MRTAALSTRRPKIKDLREIADGQFRFAISEVLAARAFGGHEPNARNAAPCTDVSSVLEDNAACHVGGPICKFQQASVPQSSFSIIGASHG